MRGSTYAAPHRAERADPSPKATVITLIVQIKSVFAVWRDRACYRRALARMGERELADIGVNWSEIAVEAGKPFWRA